MQNTRQNAGSTAGKQNFLALLDEVAKIIVEVVEETGWAPSGVVYAALMGVVPYSTYTGIIDILVQSGKLKLSNNILTIGERG
jgi:hypothetical protein